MSLAEELLADLEEDSYDDCEPMIIQEEASHELQDTLILKQRGILLNIIFINKTRIVM